jgi:acetyl/propionyl-CoA carboxylase alpha subunit
VRIRVDVDGRNYVLDLERSQAGSYRLTGVAAELGGTASIIQVRPGVYSIIDGVRCSTVHLSKSGEGLDACVEAWVGERCYRLRLSDPRDRASAANNASASGPQEVRALMPGKVVKLLVSEGDEVKAGHGLIVVEAMKMQNEMKASKDGQVTRIHVSEGCTVAPGEKLLTVE